MSEPLRVACLVPSATDLAVRLGLNVVGVSHECDHPAARGLPVLTRSRVAAAHPDGPGPGEVDLAVRAAVAAGGPLYVVDRELLAALAPEVVLSQAICDVCAARADSCDLPRGARLLELTATTLAGLTADIRAVAAICGVEERGEACIAEIAAEHAGIIIKAAGRPRVVTLEWSDPPFLGGHWVLIALATRPGEAVTRRWLVEHVLDPERDGNERTLDVHMSRLRKKLGDACVIETVWGTGYRLRPGGGAVKLRARFSLALLAAIVSLIAVFTGLGRSLRIQLIADGQAQYARGVAAASRVACEADPMRWGRETSAGLASAGLGELHVYDADLRPTSPAAPTLDPTLLARARAGEDPLVELTPLLQVLVRSHDAGPCAYMLVRRQFRPGPSGGNPPPVILFSALCMLAVLGVVLLLLGPLVRRIRRLRDEVRAAAAADYHAAITTRGSDELAELAAAFADSSRQIAEHRDAQDRRERTLREFLANTTHDVMVPLTVLQGHLSALHARGADVDPNIVRAAMQEADYIAALVHNLEIAARLDAGEPALSRDPVDLSATVKRVAARHTPLARRRGVEVVHAVPPAPLTTLGDLTLIEQALGNLVQNAVLHNQSGGHVAILLEQDDAQTFRIIIKDDGPGISADERTRLLARGERGDEARTRHPHGKGLGLSIARRVADAHAWRFDLRQAPEGGLEVELLGELSASETTDK